MDIRSLRYFKAVYEERSLSAAAKRCFVAQPSISAAIAQLEEALKVSLFTRHSKGVTATDNAKDLYPHACKVINDLQALPSLFNTQQSNLDLSISLMPFLSGSLVSQVIKTMLAQVPNLQLNLVDESEQADLRFTCQRYLTSEDIFHPLWEDDYVLAMAPDHALAKQKDISLKQIDGLPFISRTPCDIIESWHYLIHKQGIQVDVRAQVKTEEYALDLVAAGLGISLIPEHSARQRSDICLRPLNDANFKRLVGLAHHKSQSLPNRLLQSILNSKMDLQKALQKQALET
ncbi:LysR family transcriptional regulator [Marinomonas sp. SBI22]|jgi:DNA-binding transcriptional LysR family regulator|uniref:LysR family transcriptional regulator n=1 Tax=unclassified Marinomonas TaxID=196814 RepID=UPI0005F9E48E|nr:MULTISPECIES: LysR family transcriptional regulator [unclassified Marinomonas]KJZ15882.1 LysR family transcriptional regulator [Marinomonas sp. S3726]KZM43197.1 LysR family transcriptional regulator [Marinomonas sp. SBI22]KZM44768.1 LysR family transcriptional regulator [Marinomonas sp. SBI8L]